MSKRQVILSPYHLGGLNACNTLLNLPLITTVLKPIDFEGLFYSSIIQEGIKELYIFKPESIDLKYSEFLSKYIRIIDGKDNDYEEANKIVKQVFTKYLPENFMEDRKYKNTWKYAAFLLDLLLSLKKGMSLVSVFPLPDISKYDETIPPELFYPISNLINKFDVENPKLPIPRLSVSEKNVNLFKEIITSDLFENYTLTHECLEDSRITSEKAISYIETSGKNLFTKYKSVLDLKEVSISFLSLSTKVINTIFGTLPGQLSEYLLDLLSKWLKNERRIVIYQYDEMAIEVIINRLNAAFLKK